MKSRIFSIDCCCRGNPRFPRCLLGFIRCWPRRFVLTRCGPERAFVRPRIQRCSTVHSPSTQHAQSKATGAGNFSMTPSILPRLHPLRIPPSKARLPPKRSICVNACLLATPVSGCTRPVTVRPRHWPAVRVRRISVRFVMLPCAIPPKASALHC